MEWRCQRKESSRKLEDKLTESIQYLKERKKSFKKKKKSSEPCEEISKALTYGLSVSQKERAEWSGKNI